MKESNAYTTNIFNLIAKAREAEEATQALYEINSLYQDIEEVLARGVDASMSRSECAERLIKIGKLNTKIGEITKDWI